MALWVGWEQVLEESGQDRAEQDTAPELDLAGMDLEELGLGQVELGTAPELDLVVLAQDLGG